MCWHALLLILWPVLLCWLLLILWLLVHSLAVLRLLVVSSILRKLHAIVIPCSVAALLRGILLLILLRLKGGGTGSEGCARGVQVGRGTKIQASLGLL